MIRVHLSRTDVGRSPSSPQSAGRVEVTRLERVRTAHDCSKASIPKIPNPLAESGSATLNMQV